MAVTKHDLSEWLTKIVTVVLVGVLLYFFMPWFFGPPDPSTIQARFEAELREKSPQWGKATWKVCRPGARDYDVEVLYNGPRAVYRCRLVWSNDPATRKVEFFHEADARLVPKFRRR